MPYILRPKGDGTNELLQYDDAPKGWNESAYLATNGDVAQVVQSGGMPSGWWHYLQHGRKEGRTGGWDTPTDFNATEYLTANADVAQAVARGDLTAAEHYARYGAAEGRRYAAQPPAPPPADAAPQAPAPSPEVAALRQMIDTLSAPMADGGAAASQQAGQAERRATRRGRASMILTGGETAAETGLAPLQLLPMGGAGGIAGVARRMLTARAA
ncbi:hypothetical protein [Azospirillum sp. sgz302134]